MWGQWCVAWRISRVTRQEKAFFCVCLLFPEKTAVASHDAVSTFRSGAATHCAFLLAEFVCTPFASLGVVQCRSWFCPRKPFSCKASAPSGEKREFPA